MVVLLSRFISPVAPRAALGGGRGRRGRGRLRLSVHLVRLDDLVLRLGALGPRLGALDLHLERGALRVGLGARRHAARLGRLLYVGIEVYDEVADAYVPLVVIVLEVGVRVGRGASSADGRAVPHWRRHTRRLAAAAPRSPPRAHTIVALQTTITRINTTPSYHEGNHHRE